MHNKHGFLRGNLPLNLLSNEQLTFSSSELTKIVKKKYSNIKNV